MSSSMLRSRDGRRGRIVPAILLTASVLVVVVGGLAARYGTSWPRRVWWPRPDGIVLHHSASPAAAGGHTIDADAVDRWHEGRGWGEETLGTEQYHIGYHYVIPADGTIEAGRPEWMRGAHCAGYNDYLGICLIGNFSSRENRGGSRTPSEPTSEQLESLHSLLSELMKKYDIGPEDIYRHSDLGQTECPGDRFPFDAVIERLREAMREDAPE